MSSHNSKKFDKQINKKCKLPVNEDFDPCTLEGACKQDKERGKFKIPPPLKQLL